MEGVGAWLGGASAVYGLGFTCCHSLLVQNLLRCCVLSPQSL